MRHSQGPDKRSRMRSLRSPRRPKTGRQRAAIAKQSPQAKAKAQTLPSPLVDIQVPEGHIHQIYPDSLQDPSPDLSNDYVQEVVCKKR